MSIKADMSYPCSIHQKLHTREIIFVENNQFKRHLGKKRGSCMETFPANNIVVQVFDAQVNAQANENVDISRSC